VWTHPPDHDAPQKPIHLVGSFDRAPAEILADANPEAGRALEACDADGYRWSNIKAE